MAKTPPQHIAALTTTRAIAALLVFVHHYGGAVYPFSQHEKLFRSGNLAVSYFFVLSGFVLYLAHAHKPLHYPDFLRRRAARILPMYYVALLATAAYFAWLLQPHPAHLTQQMVYSLLLIQSWIPGYPMCLNGPAWSISIEIVFYLLFPLLLWWQQRRKWLFVVVTGALFAASQYLHLHFYPQRFSLGDEIIDPVFFSPAIHMSQFMIGMLGGYCYNKWRMPRRPATLLAAAIAAVCVACIQLRPDSVSYHTGLLAPLFMLFIVTLAQGNPRVLQAKWLVFTGEISFGIYVLQYPVYHLAEFANNCWVHLNVTTFFWLAMALLVAIAGLLHIAIERPMRRWITGS